MLQIYFRIGAGLIAVILAVGGFIGMEGISDSNDEVATIPPCSYDPGLPGWLGDDEVTCYWGMSGDVLTIPEEAVAADVDVSISWQKAGVWIGIAEASQSENCEEKDGYYQCEKESIAMVSGGPNSNGQLDWSPSPGDYRFVAGGDDSEQLKSFSVSWSYEAGLRWGIALPLFLISGALGLFAVIGLPAGDELGNENPAKEE